MYFLLFDNHILRNGYLSICERFKENYYFCVSAAMPGSVPCSKNSKEAPPPVEM